MLEHCQPEKGGFELIDLIQFPTFMGCMAFNSSYIVLLGVENNMDLFRWCSVVLVLSQLVYFSLLIKTWSKEYRYLRVNEVEPTLLYGQSRSIDFNQSRHL